MSLPPGFNEFVGRLTRELTRPPPPEKMLFVVAAATHKALDPLRVALVQYFLGSTIPVREITSGASGAPGHVDLGIAQVRFVTEGRAPYHVGNGLDGAWSYLLNRDVARAWLKPALADRGGWLVSTLVEIEGEGDAEVPT